MPEIPDLEVIKEFLNERIVGQEIVRVEAPRPWIVRSLAADDFASDVVGRSFGRVLRVGKDLLFPLDPGRLLVVNLMLTGHLQYTEPGARASKRMFFTLGMPEADLRYLDDRQMGLVYYLRPEQYPGPGDRGASAFQSKRAFVGADDRGGDGRGSDRTECAVDRRRDRRTGARRGAGVN